MARVRPSGDQDVEALCDIHRQAFGDEGAAIVALVRDLLADETARPTLSLLAETDHGIVGHVLFTAVSIEAARSPSAQILAPLAVLPAAQGTGVGGALVRAGLERLSASGVGLVFVLGHPGYYPRFGFEPAGKHGLVAPYPIPEKHQDAWMVQALEPGLLGNVRGRVACARALDHPEHW